MDETAAKEHILAEAKRVGFDAIGVAPVRLPPVEEERLALWIRGGMHGTMGWMASGPRADPERLLAGARSVLMGAVGYYHPSPAGSEAVGRISLYARGRDYHKVIRGMWKRLMPAVKSVLPGVNGRWFVDSAPILERAYAERAGIGWRGKNTNLIVPGLGSWFFLGGLVIDRKLPPDEPCGERCGTCTACIDACPSGALFEPFRVDGSRCISYLTIEHDGPVSVELDDRSGEWIFGCDLCQDVCPWNRNAVRTKTDGFETRPEVARLSLEEAFDLDEDGFDRLFRGSAVRRAGWKRFHRSVARAIRNRNRDGEVSD